jgi:hypothetical protein
VLLGHEWARYEKQRGHTRRRDITRARGGDQDTCMLVLEEGSAECDGVVCAGICTSTKACGYAVDGKTSFDLGSDDVTRSVVGSTEVFAGREANRRRGGTSSGRGNVAGNGGDLCEREVAAGECDGCTRAVEGQQGQGRGGGGGGRTGIRRARGCVRRMRGGERTWRE